MATTQKTTARKTTTKTKRAPRNVSADTNRVIGDVKRVVTDSQKVAQDVKRGAAANANKIASTTQELALTTLHAAVQTQQVANNFVMNVVRTGYDAQEQGLKSLRGYVESFNEAQQEWVKEAARRTEKFIKSPLAQVGVPYQKEIGKLGSQAYASAKKIADAWAEPFKIISR